MSPHGCAHPAPHQMKPTRSAVALHQRAFTQHLVQPGVPPVQIKDVADGWVRCLFHCCRQDVAHCDPEFTCSLDVDIVVAAAYPHNHSRALNFSRSSLVSVTVWYIMAPTASFKTFSWISWVNCASQKATVAGSFRMGISTGCSLYQPAAPPRGRGAGGRSGGGYLRKFCPIAVTWLCAYPHGPFFIELCTSLIQKAEQSSKNLGALAGICGHYTTMSPT